MSNLSFAGVKAREVLREKIVDAERGPISRFTSRDLHMPKVAGKTTAVIGMRRTGKNTSLR